MTSQIFLAALIFIASLTLMAMDKRLGIYVLLVVSIFLHKQLFSIYQWNILPIRIFMGGFFIWCIAYLSFWFYKNRDFKTIFQHLKSPFIFLLLSLWFVRLLSLIFTRNLLASFSLFTFFTTMVALGIFLFLYLRDKPDLTLRYIKFYIFILFGLSLFGFYQLFHFFNYGEIIGALWDVPNQIPRIGSLFWDVNHFGGLLAAVLPVLGGLVLVGKGIPKKILYGAMFLAMTAVLVLTNSRTAWLAAGVSLGLFIVTLVYRRFKLKGLSFIALIAVILLVFLGRIYYAPESPLRSEVEVFSHHRMDSFNAHFMLLEGSIEIFDRLPVLGGGYGGFFEHFIKTSVAPDYFVTDPAAFTMRVPAHTIWGEVIAETGIVGFTVFLLFVLAILSVLAYSALKAKKSEEFILTAAMFSALFGWLVAGLFYSYNSEFFFIVLFLYFMYAVSLLKGKINYNKVISHLFKDTPVVLTLILFLGTFLFFVSLGRNHLIPWDEAIYSKVAKNMVNTGEYVVQEWVPGTAWYEKPPLYNWLAASFMRLVGIGELAARMPSAIFGLLTVVVVYFFSLKLFGKVTAFISSLALLTTMHFLYYSRAAMMDVTMSFFVILSLYLYYIGRDRKTSLYWALSGLSIGFAVMVKGAVGFLPLPIIVLYEIYLLLTKQDNLSKDLLKKYFITLLYSAVVFLPWHLAMFSRFGTDFLDNYIGYHVLQRGFTAIEDKGQPFLWYLVVMRVSMRLWFVLLIPAFLYLVAKVFKNKRKYVFLLLSGLFILAFFSIASSKLVWYITPIYPIAAIVVGAFVRDAVNFVLKKSRFFDNTVSRFLIYFLMTLTIMVYFYYHKDMVYTSDLTGPPAEMLKLKDREFGVEKKVYVYNQIEKPLVMFYTDGPYEIISHSDMVRVFKSASDDAEFAFLTKSSRYSSLEEEFSRVRFVGRNREWVLGRFAKEPPPPPLLPLPPSEEFYTWEVLW